MASFWVGEKIKKSELPTTSFALASLAVKVNVTGDEAPPKLPGGAIWPLVAGCAELAPFF
ncbi:MAG: hypothetical protein E6J14_15170 [Chloroflexi bacterium]|nr:MAG: hypothetical protein E6J14_15170 [Chloroflexota bacterium]